MNANNLEHICEQNTQLINRLPKKSKNNPAKQVKFLDSVLLAFSRKTLFSLKKILNDNPKRAPEKIKLLFEEIAKHFLPYTAFPEAEITLFLCDIAEWAADELNQNKSPGYPFTAINLMFPNTNTESKTNKPHLGTYEEGSNKVLPEPIPTQEKSLRLTFWEKMIPILYPLQGFLKF